MMKYLVICGSLLKNNCFALRVQCVSLAVVKYKDKNPHKSHPSPSQTSNAKIVSFQF